MTWLKRGSEPRPRRKDKNFYAKNAQARLNEVLPVIHDRLDNALAVNSHEVIIYKQNHIGLPCACNKFNSADMEVVKEDNPKDHDTPPVVADSLSSMSDIGVTFNEGGLFGHKNIPEGLAKVSPNTEEVEFNSIGVDTDHMPSEDELAQMDSRMRDIYEDNMMVGNSVNCGVCFRTGVVPGYTSVGWSYSILDSMNVVNSEGYYHNTAEHPVRMESEDVEGNFVEYSVLVPLFFSEVKFSVRDNTEVLKREVLYFNDGEEIKPIDYSILDKNRGKEVRLRVHSRSFTHASIAFNLGADPILANVSEETESLNYLQENTVGNLTLVLPPRVGTIQAGDIIVMPSRNYVLKVTDAPRKQTADRVKIEWLVTTRTLQRSETLCSIHTGYLLAKPN